MKKFCISDIGNGGKGIEMEYLRDRKEGDRCASIGSDFTLCSLAIEAYETEDEEITITVADKGQTVTCPDCRRHITLVRNSFTRFSFKEFE